MKLQLALRHYLKQRMPGAVHKEPWCTCGSPNHVRVLLFRVDGQPVTVIIPEGCELTAAQLRRVIPEAQVEQLGKRELEAICAASEGGFRLPFENPFGTAVYLDHNLLHFETLVFCPFMFSGRRGECFRVRTKDFQTLVHASVLPLFPTFVPAPDG